MISRPNTRASRVQRASHCMLSRLQILLFAVLAILALSHPPSAHAAVVLVSRQTCPVYRWIWHKQTDPTKTCYPNQPYCLDCIDEYKLKGKSCRPKREDCMKVLQVIEQERRNWDSKKGINIIAPDDSLSGIHNYFRIENCGGAGLLATNYGTCRVIAYRKDAKKDDDVTAWKLSWDDFKDAVTRAVEAKCDDNTVDTREVGFFQVSRAEDFSLTSSATREPVTLRIGYDAGSANCANDCGEDPEFCDKH